MSLGMYVCSRVGSYQIVIIGNKLYRTGLQCVALFTNFLQSYCPANGRTNRQTYLHSYIYTFYEINLFLYIKFLYLFI